MADQATTDSSVADSTPSQPSEPKGKWKQNFNAAGVSLFFQLLYGNQSLAIPHISVTDIRSINWEAMKTAGFKGLVFDKDNTLSEPFATVIDPRLANSLAKALEVFEGKAVLYSNSAGLEQYDPLGEEAAGLEAALGIPVLRHKEKKPAGGNAELCAHFGCSSSELVMIGDRYLTDVVFGNRHGMLTVRPAPLTNAGEPTGVVLARRVEEYFVWRWTGRGVKAPPHQLVPGGDITPFVLASPLD